VKAGQHPGNYVVVTGIIPGSDPKLKDEEIAFSCHLDHQRPGANDNASGCSAILEVARTLQRLIEEKKLERPARTIRFIFPPEIEGTLALLNASRNSQNGSKPSFTWTWSGAVRRRRRVSCDTRPMSLRVLFMTLAWAFAEWVNEESYKIRRDGEGGLSDGCAEGGRSRSAPNIPRLRWAATMMCTKIRRLGFRRFI